MQIEIVEPKLLAGVVADEIVALVQEALADRPRCSIALSGGSTPATIYRAISHPPRVGEIEWGRLDLFLGDERWVPETDNLSNYKMIKESLLLHLPEPGPKVYPVNTSLSSPGESAKDYEKTLRSVLGKGSGSGVIFDLMILGIGEDGHTASLFPGSPVLKKSDALCYAVSHPLDDTKRITLSVETVFSARRVIFIATGKAKAEIVQKVIEGSDSPEVYPARFFTGAMDRTSWFLDSEAGALLGDR